MDLFTQFREAVLNLYLAKLRTLLAILGILVGTGSVVALISSSQLATAHALDQFKTLGTNLLALSAQDNQSNGDSSQNNPEDMITLKTVEQLAKSSNQIVLAAPYTTLYQNILFGGQTFSGSILGATENLADIAKVSIARGRFISILDRYNYYCVIGDKVAAGIQSMGVDPMYKQIQVGNIYFTIVGVAKPWQPNLFLFADIDNGIIIPIETSMLLSKYTQINDILFRLIQKPDLNAVQQELTAKMATLFPDKQVTFRNPQQIIQIVAKQRATFTWLLGAIGGISLIVGGIGVMNIMLVSVVERRGEIGIRMAIGAKQADILKMFLIESIVLTVLGGIIGIIFGTLVSFILALASGWTFHFYLLPSVLGFIVSVCTGVISGFYPAWRASQLDPIQTLQGGA